MKKTNRYLTIILVIQIGVFAASRLAAMRSEPEKPKKLFTKLDTSQVTTIRLEDKDHKVVELEKRDGAWVLKSGGGYPVEKSKVTEFLAHWPDLTVSQLVSQKVEHQRALEVAADNFQRKITLTQSGQPKPWVFFLGTSSGVKDVHLRFDQEQPVYLVKGVSAWDAGSAASDWVSTDYFKVERDAIVSLHLRNSQGEIQLNKGPDGTWQLAGVPPQTKLKSSEIDSLISTASSVALRDPVGKTVDASFGLAPPKATLTVVTETKVVAKDGGPAGTGPDAGGAAPAPVRATHTLELGAQKGEDYYAKSNSSSFVVTVASWAADPLMKKKTDDLLDKGEDKDKNKDMAPGMGMGGGMGGSMDGVGGEGMDE